MRPATLAAAAAAAEPPPPYPPSVLAPPASLGRKSDCASSRRPRDASIRDVSLDASDREVETEPSCSVERGTPPAGPPPAGPPGPAPANPEASEHAAPRLAVREPPPAGSGRVPAGDEETMSHFEPRPCPAAPPDGFTQPPARRPGPPPPGPRCHEYGPGPTSSANLFATSSTLQSPRLSWLPSRLVSWLGPPLKRPPRTDGLPERLSCGLAPERVKRARRECRRVGQC